jgi:hypothetical protein
MESADEGFDDGFDDGRGALALPAPEGDPGAASPWRRRIGILGAAAAAVVAAAGFLAWRSSAHPTRVALAGIDPASARARLESRSIPCEVRDGAAWVAPEDVRRAVEACGETARPGNPVAEALAEESIFASGETVRARRSAATLRLLESAIAMQPGVDRASVVVGEPARTSGPGGAAGGAASVTVSMRSGRMSQDLVDAIAMLVAGACPGVRPESVVIVEAGEGRVRAARDAASRAQVDAARARESVAESLIASLLPDLPVTDVRVRESAHGSIVATVELARAEAEAVAAESGAAGVGDWIAAERELAQERVAPFVGGPDGCAFALQLVVAPVAAGHRPAASASTDVPRAEPSLGSRSVPTSAVDERSMPLGPSSAAGGFPVGWAVALVAGIAVACGAWWWRSRGSGSGPTPEDADDGLPGFDEPAVEHAELSAEVARSVPVAAELLSRWIAGGHAEDAAHVVVALDAGAASGLLQALPAGHVQAVTAALSSLESPTAPEIDAAARRFAAELELSVGEHADPMQEAA